MISRFRPAKERAPLTLLMIFPLALALVGLIASFIGIFSMKALKNIDPAKALRLSSIIAAVAFFGFAFAIFVYIVVNLSMVLGLLPIVGSPLPIMSYGGSSMLATMIGFGIVLSAKINHKQAIS